MDTEGPGAQDPHAHLDAPSDHVPPATRRANVLILLTFLGVFLALLIVFRTVLFPFLMAMFIAYLVEPVVAWVTKSKLFGIRWARGPTIVLIYVIVIGGVVFSAWKGLTATASYVRNTARTIAESAEEEVRRAQVTLKPAFEHLLPIHVPKGTRLTAEGKELTTQHDIRIEEIDSAIPVLIDGELAHAISEDAALKIVSGEGITQGDGKPLALGEALGIEMGRMATGLELQIEQELITPIVDNMAGLGITVEPTTVREFISHKTEVWKETLPEKLGQSAVRFAGTIALSIYQFFLILMLTAFIVTDRRGISRFFVNITPEPYRPRYKKLVQYIDDGLAGVIRGQLVICLVNGVLTYIGLLLLGVKGALILSVIAAVLSLIPIFGTIVSSIPIVLIAATDGIDKGVLALLWIVFIHMLEANMLNPIIMGSHAKMHPVVIVFALLAGEHSFGVWGALLAVPTMSIIQSCFRFYLHEIEGLPHPEPDEKGQGTLLQKLLSRFKGGGDGTKPEASS